MLGFPTGPGYGFCAGGFHIAAIPDLTSREGGLYCASHMPPTDPPPDNKPDPPRDPPHYGRCCVPKCDGIRAVWLVPNDQKWYCAEHLLVILRRAGRFGK